MKKIEVVAAIVYHKDEILCVQRSQNKLSYISEKFEFPGGKIEVGESKKEALQRELLEELSMKVNIQSLFLTVVHEYPDFEITMHCFICTVDTKEITLHEHIDHKWLTIENLKNLNWAAADIPVVDKLVFNG